MLNHILVTLDGSQLAEEALAYAEKVIKPGGQVMLLSVVDVPDFPMYNFYPAPVTMQESDYSAAVDDMSSQTGEYLDKVAERLRREGLHVHTKVKVGEPAAAIVEEAQKLKVDAIVMSTHGRSGFSRWLFGSITQKVLSAMPCPVLVIPGSKSLMEKSGESPQTTTSG